MPAAATNRSRLSEVIQRRLPERPYRLLTLMTVISILALIGSGAWVRLSESGLGCPTWPNCYAHRLATNGSYHSLIEFVNRCVITLVAILVILAFIGALRRRNPRRDLVWLSFGLIAGYLGEAVLGGITVLLKLAPELVAAHLVLAMALLICAVHLHWRAGDMSSPGAAAAKPAAPTALDARLLARAILAAVTLLVILGTVATGSGPRAGSPHTPRFHFAFSTTVAIHAMVGMFLFGLVVASFFILRATGAPQRARTAQLIAVATIAVQGALGVAQYYTHLATGLVELHVLGAGLIVVALARFNLELGPPRTTEARPAIAAGRSKLAPLRGEASAG